MKPAIKENISTAFGGVLILIYLIFTYVVLNIFC